MKRYILTGTPGAGKTSLIRYLEMMGHEVVEEAATDIIALEQAQGLADPWNNPPVFIDKIVALQMQRQARSNAALQFFDRCPVDAYALAIYADISPTALLQEELSRIKQEEIFQKRVFFIENLGFCVPTEARKITFDDALRFEKIHEEVYESLGYELIKIAPQPIPQRVDNILRLL